MDEGVRITSDNEKEMFRQLLKTVIDQINNKPTISSELPLVIVNIINQIFVGFIDQFQATIYSHTLGVIRHDNQRLHTVTRLPVGHGADEQVLFFDTETLISEEVLVDY